MFDFTPLYRSSIGFDHLARMLDQATTFETPLIRLTILSGWVRTNI